LEGCLLLPLSPFPSFSFFPKGEGKRKVIQPHPPFPFLLEGKEIIRLFLPFPPFSSSFSRWIKKMKVVRITFLGPIEKIKVTPSLPFLFEGRWRDSHIFSPLFNGEKNLSYFSLPPPPPFLG